MKVVSEDLNSNSDIDKQSEGAEKNLEESISETQKLRNEIDMIK